MGWRSPGTLVLFLVISLLDSAFSVVNDPCSDYIVLNEAWRNVQQVNDGSADNCDSGFTGKWYRFKGPAGHAMPTKAPPSVYRCGTDAPMWMNGTHPTLADGEVSRQVCVYWSGNTCNWQTNIKVRACRTGYFVYKLPAAPGCYRAYCGESAGIRLVGGSSNEGRVEVFHNGQWGTVCDDSWHLSDAHVVCRQLGYPRATAAPHRAAFGQGSGQIWLYNVACSGSETSITDYVNECAAHSDNCDPNATCTNTPGSFTCTCAEGYYGNGTSCTGKACPKRSVPDFADIVLEALPVTECSEPALHVFRLGQDNSVRKANYGRFCTTVPIVVEVPGQRAASARPACSATLRSVSPRLNRLETIVTASRIPDEFDDNYVRTWLSRYGQVLVSKMVTYRDKPSIRNGSRQYKMVLKPGVNIPSSWRMADGRLVFFRYVGQTKGPVPEAGGSNPPAAGPVQPTPAAPQASPEQSNPDGELLSQESSSQVPNDSENSEAEDTDEFSDAHEPDKGGRELFLAPTPSSGNQSEGTQPPAGDQRKSSRRSRRRKKGEGKIETPSQKSPDDMEVDKKLKRQYQSTKDALAALETSEAQGAIVRSRIKHFEDGEKCTSFFLKQAASNGRKKRISAVRDSAGQVVREDDKISDVFRQFYEDLFTEEPVDLVASNQLCDSLENILDPEEPQLLETPLTPDELLTSVLSMENNKCPGSDGLPKEFYTTFWHLVADDLLSVFKEVFEDGELSPSQKFGVVTLLPKKGDELDPKNRRPISLLNTDYKLLTKALNNRLPSVAASVLHSDQTCGVPDRSIQCNLRLIRDIVVYANTTNIDCAIVSLDQAKAFDRVNISFLHKTLTKMGFGPSFRKWVSILYRDITSSVLVNDSLSQPFALTRGVRQGCPLSPLLYAISLEPFAATVRNDTEVHGVKLPGGHEAKMSLYADDNSAFPTSDKSIARLFELVELYNRGSGSKLNLDKCEGLWLGKWRNRSISPVNIKWTSGSIRLLGGAFGNIDMSLINWKEGQRKFVGTLQMWGARSLSFTGKVTVANALAAAKLWYLASVFIPPDSVIKGINTALFNFFWDNRREMVSRNTIYLPPEKGGWGLIHIAKKAKCLYSRPFSDILSQGELPWVQLARYWLGIRLVGGNFFNDGRVEVLHDGQWGTICDDGWQLNDAHVVCRQLGYTGAAKARGSASFGRGTGQIWLDNVRCAGFETSITDCLHRGWGSHDCDHSEDAGVVCDPYECLHDGNNTCHSQATCSNTTGSFTCNCNTGFAGNGVICTDVNECVVHTHNCYPNATCTNTPGSFTCACAEGYYGSGTSCTATVVSKAIITNAPSGLSSLGGRGIRQPPMFADIVLEALPVTECPEPVLHVFRLGQDNSVRKVTSKFPLVPVIAGVVAAVVVSFAAGTALMFYKYRRRRKERTNASKRHPGPTALRQLEESRLEAPPQQARRQEERLFLRPTSIVNELRPSLADDTEPPFDIPLRIMASERELAWKDISLSSSLLGAGNFGEVRKGTVKIDGSEIQSAIKMLKRGADEESKEEFQQEVDVMRHVGFHPNIINLLGVCNHKGQRYMALELATSGDLLKYLRKSRVHEMGRPYANMRPEVVPFSTLSRVLLMRIACDVASGMKHLAAKDVIHRDLAARNVLLTDSLIAKVADFGLSREGTYKQKSGKAIPFRSTAIEALSTKIYTTKSDLRHTLQWDEVETFDEKAA
ncbi:TIE1 [Branchiostoma lanceolatum]|uniref:TIE1 protein n=1 Tax=Branchiostoma lanceolatum TaxID=7740 RepID=A0A8K0F1J1_BRALA|nr:TIE1 [Branchiostoma lanceolatum]